MMREVHLVRFYSDDKQSLGIDITVKDETTAELFVCKSLELAWRDNQPNVSCIPASEYICKWTRSNRLSNLTGHDVFTYEVLNVPGRSGIRIHSANYFFQLLGCIALGDAHKDINIDGNLDVIHSGNTITYFAKLMEYKDFLLNITE